MSSQSKRKGSLYESALENYYNEQGFKARRLPRAGAKDIGDIAIEVSDFVVVVEAKDVKANAYHEWLRQAEVEAEHYEDKYKSPTIGVVARKNRNHSVGSSHIMMTNETFIALLRIIGARL